MTEEKDVTETENQATVKEDSNEATQGEKDGEESKEDDKEGKDKKPWWQKRFDRFTAQNQALSRSNEQLLSEVAALKAGKPNESGLTKEQLEAEIDRRADEKISVREFNAKCNAVYEDGAEEYPDFADSVKTLGTMGLMSKDFLETVTELDESHKVLYHLGKNPEEADKIQSLSPAKQAIALAKLEKDLSQKSSKKEEKEEGEMKEEKKISKAPAPVKTVDGKSNKSSGSWATKYYDGMPQDEFEAWDEKNSKRA